MSIYVLSQIFIFINYIFLIITYQLSNNKKILIYNTIACTSSMIGLFLLKAYSGCAMSFIAIVRNLIFIKNKKDKKTLFLTFIIITIFTICTYDGLLSLLPTLATILYTLSVWQNKSKTYKLYGIPIEICWLSYHIYINSIVGIIFESILSISVLIGILRKNTK